MAQWDPYQFFRRGTQSMEKGTMALLRWLANSPADIHDMWNATGEHHHEGLSNKKWAISRLSVLSCRKYPAMELWWASWNKISLQLLRTNNRVLFFLVWVCFTLCAEPNVSPWNRLWCIDVWLQPESSSHSPVRRRKQTQMVFRYCQMTTEIWYFHSRVWFIAWGSCCPVTIVISFPSFTSLTKRQITYKWYYRSWLR